MQAFLSHVASDEDFARALSTQLEKRGVSVWIAEQQILPGENVWFRTGEALRNSKALVVLLSPEATQSENIRREIEYALGDPNYEGRVFPVLVRPTQDVPWILRKFKIFNAKQGPSKISAAVADALRVAAAAR
jgi:hypothetical protein